MDHSGEHRPGPEGLLQQLGPVTDKEALVPAGGPCAIQLSDLPRQRVGAAGDLFHGTFPLP